ncbi:MAG: hypothetical protein WCG27_10275, partial [Pseudomonadota bacterium]
YRAEAYNAPAKLQEEISKRIVGLLEKLGKSNAARTALDERTRMEAPGAKPQQGGIVVAEVNGNPIYDYQVHEVVDQLEKNMGKKINTQDKNLKMQLLQKIVADELLYQKAKRMGYDREPQVRQQVEMIERQILSDKIISEEMHGQVKVEGSDLKNYYTANKDRYQMGPGKKKKALSFEQAKGNVESDYRMEKVKEAYTKIIDQLIKTEKVKIYPENLK